MSLDFASLSVCPLEFRYQHNKLYIDFFYAIGGLIFVLGILLGLEALLWVDIVCILLALLFSFYVRNLWEKWHDIIVVDGDGIASRVGFISWDSVEVIRLRHYGQRRFVGRGKGFFEVLIIGAGIKIRLDSKLLDFRDLAILLMGFRDAHDLVLDGDTAHNFGVLLSD